VKVKRRARLAQGQLVGKILARPSAEYEMGLVNTSRWLTAVAILLVACPPAFAQRLEGIIRDSTTREPIGGAVVSVTDSGGRFLSRGVATATGRFSVFRLDGSAKLSILRIGYEPRVMLLTTSDTAVAVLMRAVPMMLSTVTLTSRRVCPTDNSDKGESPALALWEQARAGLLAAVVGRELGAPKLDVLSFDRELDPVNKRLRSERHVTKRLVADQPYVAGRMASAFAEDGYVIDAPGGRTYFAPDELVLLHESFVSTHCMRLVAGEAEHAGDVGISFEPAELKGRDTLSDIKGVLWIDRQRRALRSLDFEYTRVESEARGSGGRLVFQLMPTGVPIIERWAIRYPILVSDARFGLLRASLPRERRTNLRVLSYHETGGEVGAAQWPDGTTWRGTLPRLVGSVVDSAGTPISHAAVIVSGAEQRDTIFTGQDGGFVSPFFTQGIYSVSASESLFVGQRVMAALPVATRLWEGDSRLEVTLPPRKIILGLLCIGQSHVPGTGVILGRALSPDGEPEPGLSVIASWASNASGTLNVSKSIDTRDDGRFVICGLPPDQEIHLRASTRHTAAEIVVHTRGADAIPLLLSLAPRR
jgi:hypothetical protein